MGFLDFCTRVHADLCVCLFAYVACERLEKQCASLQNELELRPMQSQLERLEPVCAVLVADHLRLCAL